MAEHIELQAGPAGNLSAVPSLYASLSSKQAYESLFEAVQRTVDHHKPDKRPLAVLRRFFFKPLLKGRFGGGVESGVESLFVFFAGVLQLIAGAVISTMNDGYRATGMIIEGALLLGVCTINLALNIREEYEREAEVAKRVEDLADQYSELLHTSDTRQWPYQSVDPFSPASPSIALVHTYRDGVLVNIPANLLVEGDLVQLGAGTRAPGDMRCIEPGVADSQQRFVKYGELMRPLAQAPMGEDETACQLHNRQKYIMMETPLVRDVTLALDSAIHRPVPPMVQEMRIVTAMVFKFVLGISLAVSFIVNVVRFFVLPSTWPEMFISLQVYVSIPLLPLAFPWIWHGVNSVGVAKLLTLYDYLLENQYRPEAANIETSRKRQRDNVSTRSGTSSSSNNYKDGLADPETEFELPYSKIWKNFRAVVAGRAFSTLPRSSSLLYGLGSITVLCAVDKEGVLAHPMPAAEKVFVMNPQEQPPQGNTDSAATLEVEGRHPTGEGSESDAEVTGSHPRRLSVEDWGSTASEYEAEHTDSAELLPETEDPPHKKQSPDSTRKTSAIEVVVHPADETKNEEPTTEDLSKEASEKGNGKVSIEVTGTEENGNAAENEKENGHENTQQVVVAKPKKVRFQRHGSTQSFGSRVSMLSDTSGYSDYGRYSDQYPDVHVPHIPVELEVTYDPSRENGLRFMDVNWRERLPSLKPLGLNVLLNTSCQQSVLATHLADHLRYLTLLEEIGFSDTALNMFVRRQQIWAFSPKFRAMRHTSDTDRKDGSAAKRALSVGKEKANGEKVMGKESEGEGEKERPYEVAEREPIAHAVAQVVEELRSGTLQLMTEGTPSFVLEMCTELWDGHDLRPLEKEDRRRIIEFYQKVSKYMPCVAFSYRPLAPSQAYEWFDRNNPVTLNLPPHPPSKPGDLGHTLGGLVAASEKRWRCQNMLQGQIFIGMVASQRQPREFLVKLIDDLDDAGIRFVFFSAKDANTSKAFAEKMGLETGWNCHISLKEDSDDHSVEGQAQLPKGIKNIRPHLENVDDVPLLVPLFTDCTSFTTHEMICIMQEHGEVVCCLGSSLQNANAPCFSGADIALGVEPLSPKRCLNIAGSTHFVSGTPQLKTLTDDMPTENGRSKWSAAKLPWKKTSSSSIQRKVTESLRSRLYQSPESPVLALSAEFTNVTCALAIGRDTNLYVIMHMVREARRLTYNLRMCFSFVMGCHLSASLVVLGSYLLLLPPILDVIQLLWLCVVIVPVLAVSLIASPSRDALMEMMPDKNNEHLKEIKKYWGYFMLRFVPSVVVAILMFALTLRALCIKTTANYGGTCDYYGAEITSSDYVWTSWSQRDAMAHLLAKNIVLFFLVLWFVVTSLTFTHRTQLLFRLHPSKLFSWTAAAVSCLLLQIVFFAVSMGSYTSSTPSSITDVPWYVYAIGFLWVLPLLLIHELAKRVDSARFIKLQKRSRLVFDTKLGMHSPV